MAFYGHKLKHASLIITYTLNSTVHILQTVGERPIKVSHTSKLIELHPNFDFSSNDGDILVDALGNTSVQSSY